MTSTITFQIEERWGGRKVLALYCSCGLSYEWEADENGMVLIDYSRWEEHLKSDCRDVTEQEWQAVERQRQIDLALSTLRQHGVDVSALTP